MCVTDLVWLECAMFAELHKHTGCVAALYLPTRACGVGIAQVVGHGMNAEELAKNPQLSEFFVKVRLRLNQGCGAQGGMDSPAPP